MENIIPNYLFKLDEAKKKLVKSPKTQTVYACGRIWTDESLKAFREKQSEFIKDTYRPFIIRMAKLKEADIIEYMESQDNLTGYIRDLIRKDMEAKNYRMSDEARQKIELASLGDSLTEADIKALDEAIKEIKDVNENLEKKEGENNEEQRAVYCQNIKK